MVRGGRGKLEDATINELEAMVVAMDDGGEQQGTAMDAEQLGLPKPAEFTMTDITLDQLYFFVCILAF